MTERDEELTPWPKAVPPAEARPWPASAPGGEAVRLPEAAPPKAEVGEVRGEKGRQDSTPGAVRPLQYAPATPAVVPPQPWPASVPAVETPHLPTPSPILAPAAEPPERRAATLPPSPQRQESREWPKASGVTASPPAWPASVPGETAPGLSSFALAPVPERPARAGGASATTLPNPDAPSWPRWAPGGESPSMPPGTAGAGGSKGGEGPGGIAGVMQELLVAIRGMGQPKERAPGPQSDGSFVPGGPGPMGGLSGVFGPPFGGR